MRRLLARRVLQAVGIVFLVATFTFVLIHLAPGDPFSAGLDSGYITEATRAQLRAAYGLDRPLPEQYLLYLRNVARGDLGYSFSMRRPVADALAVALPNTLLLMSVALFASFAIGILLGVVQAQRRGTALDHGVSALSLFFYSVPDFWLAIMAILVFAYWIPIFPTTGMYDPVMHEYMGRWQQFSDRAVHLVLPVVTLTLVSAAAIARHQRSAVLEVASQDYVRTARAKGAPERRVVMHHILRNALLPVITLFGLAFPALLGGSIFVEKVFAWPGMGYLTVNAIASRDYPLVTAAMMIAAALVALGNLVADVLYAVIDPRLRNT
jgi:peptide/nickel transport system permease protein